MACRHLQIEITSRCNLRCKTCLYGHYPERWVPADLDDAPYRKIIAGRRGLSTMPCRRPRCLAAAAAATPSRHC